MSKSYSNGRVSKVKERISTGKAACDSGRLILPNTSRSIIEIIRQLPQAAPTSSRRQPQRSGRAPQRHRKLWRATDLRELLAITLKFRMLREGCAYFAKDSRRIFVRRINQSIVHPLPLPARAHDASPPQICQVTRNLWLARL